MERNDEGAARLSEALQPADGASTAVQSGKAPLTGPWRARALPAKVSAAPGPQQSEKRADADLQGAYGRLSDETAEQSVSRQTMNFLPRQTSELAENVCPPDARNTAERWYACIQSLTGSVPERLLEAELEALLAAFPEFKAAADQ
jgi:hypothetical protein